MATANQRRQTPELDALVRLFYDDSGLLGRFTEVKSDEMPDVFRKLLDHDAHMTVTVEAHHASPVDVQVLETSSNDTHYWRKILLTRQTDNKVVQYGIVRLTLSFLAPEVRREIESERIPLGRVLIDHNVLREVRLLSLWKVEPGDELTELLELPAGEDGLIDPCYGRTALIYCNGVPAVELLEIVTPS